MALIDIKAVEKAAREEVRKEAEEEAKKKVKNAMRDVANAETILANAKMKLEIVLRDLGTEA